MKKPQYKSVTDEFEALYATYIAKLKRHDELVAAGRYGYQLRMPARAIGNAKDALREFGKQNNVEVESLFNYRSDAERAEWEAQIEKLKTQCRAKGGKLFAVEPF